MNASPPKSFTFCWKKAFASRSTSNNNLKVIVVAKDSRKNQSRCVQQANTTNYRICAHTQTINNNSAQTDVGSTRAKISYKHTNILACNKTHIFWVRDMKTCKSRNRAIMSEIIGHCFEKLHGYICVGYARIPWDSLKKKHLLKLQLVLDDDLSTWTTVHDFKKQRVVICST